MESRSHDRMAQCLIRCNRADPPALHGPPHQTFRAWETLLGDLLEQLPGVRETFLPALLQVWPERIQQAGRRRLNRPLGKSLGLQEALNGDAFEVEVVGNRPNRPTLLPRSTGVGKIRFP